jgi:GntR family transcriptional regulator
MAGRASGRVFHVLHAAVHLSILRYTVATPEPGQLLPISLSQASGVPFYRQITDQVTDLIRRGALAACTQLPSVRHLAVQLKVSLITTRRAYADLEAVGLIVSRQGQGTFVAEAAATASRERLLAEAREQLAAAFHRARLLGFRGAALRRFVDALVRQEDTDA